MLVDEHAEGDAVGVEAVQEILDVAADEGVKAKLLLVLDDSLSHGGNHIVVTVTDLNQELQETKSKMRKCDEKVSRTHIFLSFKNYLSGEQPLSLDPPCLFLLFEGQKSA